MTIFIVSQINSKLGLPNNLLLQYCFPDNVREISFVFPLLFNVIRPNPSNLSHLREMLINDFGVALSDISSFNFLRLEILSSDVFERTNKISSSISFKSAFINGMSNL